MGATTSRHYAPLALDSPPNPTASASAAAAAAATTTTDAPLHAVCSACTRSCHSSSAPCSAHSSALLSSSLHTCGSNADHVVPHPSSLHPAAATDAQPEEEPRDDDLVPTMFHWSFGGRHVFVAGAWDDWKLKTPMSKNGQHHMALVYIPCGQFQFKYFVDNTWQCAPNLPTTTDAHGNNNNLITILPVDPQFDVSTPLTEHPPSSPTSSYDQSTLNSSLSTDPPLLPPFLEHRCLKPLPDDISPKVAPLSPHAPSVITKHHPQHRSSRPFFSHVSVDHLYVARSSNPSLRSFSHTSRHYGKLINTVFVTSAPQPQPQQHDARKDDPHRFVSSHPS
ncbi:SNF1-related protein kinase regulatory subunit beta-2 [Gracilariopsis chorda]|uniref:SNF1-related protein kinase regulatory subunit beta-2 n=1 Tax=Gracilariopsis chorda TaxID=448386 RepID=A0A2V3IHL5_9FLOR|nr:SNF1-related protein kinase regulatory subunit beta-2 [Gracilariopsis chorda]|eukprot:PXF41513.1 SNF1-related protein kinase regulatory subunit beta-2 [Gracilariopsis chorda]